MPTPRRASGSWRGSRVLRARRGIAWGNVCDCFFQIYGATDYRQERGNESLVAAAGEWRLRRPHGHGSSKLRERPRRRSSGRAEGAEPGARAPYHLLRGRLRRHGLLARSKPRVHAIPVLRLPSEKRRPREPKARLPTGPGRSRTTLARRRVRARRSGPDSGLVFAPARPSRRRSLRPSVFMWSMRV